MKKLSRTEGWTLAGVMTTLVLPAAMAVLPGIRKRYGVATFSLPSIALMGGLWLWQRHMEKRSAR